MKKKIYFENLDGLRFLCFLSVFFFHSFFTSLPSIQHTEIYHFIKRDIFANGNLGVNFFFVLSGFLITYLLIEEKKLNGHINLKNFWIRRMLRIWPLFYACVFFGFVIFPALKSIQGQVSKETASPVFYLTFLNNFDFIKNGLPDSSVLGVLWSVAIEEQFYLLWPIILSVLPINRYWIAFAVLLFISLLFRALNDSALLHEHHTFSCIGDMAMGALGAWLIIEKPKFKVFIQQLKPFHIGIIYVLFLFIYLFRDEVLYSSYYIRIFERLFISVVILLIILEQNYADHSLFKMSKFKMLSKLGIITYGLYCLHFIGILITIQLTQKLGIEQTLFRVLFVDTATALVLTIIISQLSYSFFEMPFLKLKDKFAFITK